MVPPADEGTAVSCVAALPTRSLSTTVQRGTARHVGAEVGLVRTASERVHRFGAETTDERRDLPLPPFPAAGQGRAGSS